MSFSRSSKGSYRNGNYGSNHYKRSGGFFGNLFGGSGSDRRHGYENYPQQPMNYPQQPPMNNPAAQQNLAVCSRCNASVPAGAAFCMQCGGKLNTGGSFCISCGEKLPQNAKFCLKCGSKQGG